MRLFPLIIGFFLLLISFQAQAQKKNDVKYNAEGYMQKVGRGKDGYIKLMKNVRFDIKKKNTVITGDSAFYYEKRGFMQVFGRVVVKEGDSTTIRGRKLDYDLDKRTAQFRQNVVYTSGQSMTLTTDFLDYDFATKNANYFNGGKVNDKTTTLTSQRGLINTQNNTVVFTGNVVLISPDFTLKAEKLSYNTKTKIAITTTPTEIINKDGVVTMAEKGGTFNTGADQTTLSDATIETDTYIIKAEKIQFDDAKKLYTAKGKVVLNGKEDDVTIYGDEAKFTKDGGLSKVYGNPLMKKLMGSDTLYLTADTLASFDSDNKAERYLLAFKQVRIFSKDFSGISDSLAYMFGDSSMYFFTDPVLWSDKSQIEADSIRIQLAYNKIDKMHMSVNSFIVTEDTIHNFNQIKGRKMLAQFVDGNMDKLYVYGNGESIYFALENEVDLVGMNKILCSDMTIRMLNNKVENITFYKNPDAVFIPPHELQEPDRRLPGFNWRIQEKPTRMQVLKSFDPSNATKEKKDLKIQLN